MKTELKELKIDFTFMQNFKNFQAVLKDLEIETFIRTAMTTCWALKRNLGAQKRSKIRCQEESVRT